MSRKALALSSLNAGFVIESVIDSSPESAPVKKRIFVVFNYIINKNKLFFISIH